MLKFRNAWVYIVTAGVACLVIFNAIFAVLLRQDVSWFVMIPVGIILVMGAIWGFFRLPTDTRQRLSESRRADVKGGLLLGVFVILAFAATLGVLENYARTRTESQWVVYHLHPVTNTVIPYPNQHVTDYLTRPLIPHTVTTDADGFRVTEHTDVPSAEFQIDILALGDSFTFGLVVENDQTYPYVMERALEKQLGPAYNVTVMNTGISGIAIEDERAIYEYLMGKGQHYDVITLGYYPGNDLEDITGMPFRREVLQTDPVPDWVMANSALLRWQRRDEYAENIPRLRRDVEEVQAALPPKDELMRIYEEDFAVLVEQVRANDQRLIVMIINAFRDRFVGSEETQFMIDLGKKYNVEVVIPPFRTDADYLEPIDPHFSPQGNEFIGAFLADAIAKAYLPEIAYESPAMKIFRQPDGAYDVYRISDDQGIFVGRLTVDAASVTAEDGWSAMLEGESIILRDSSGEVVDEGIVEAGE